MKFYLETFLKSVMQIQVWLKLDKNIGCFTWRPKDVLLTATQMQLNNTKIYSYNKANEMHYFSNLFS